MALAYISGSFVSAGNASGGDLTLARPTGTVDGSLVVILVYFEPDTTTITVSPGTWETVTIANTGAFKLQAFVKRAASEPASYTISNSTAGNQWRTAVGAAYSGGTGTGTLIDVSGGSQADAVISSGQTAPSVTTTGADRMLLFAYGNFSGNNVASMTGAATNLRGSFGSVALADALRATAGATGTSRPLSGPGTEDYAAMHVALISDTGGGGTQTIGMQTIASTLTLPNPSVSQGAQTVGMNAIASTLALSQPTVTPGGVTVATNAIASTVATPNPTVSFPTQTVTPDTVSGTADLYNPSVTADNPPVTSGPNSGGTFASDASVGAVAWTNPGNAASSDNTYATASVNNQITEYLKATNFGFAVPAGSTILGIAAEAEVKSNTASRIADNAIRIVKGGTIGTTDRSRGDSTPWPTTDTYAEWGSSSDLWGETWTVSDINASTFGVAISAKALVAGAITVSIDHIRLTVTYQEPASQTVVMNTISSTAALSQPSVTPGGVTVVAQAIASTLALYQPTVVPDQLVLANAISSTLALYTPSVVYDQTAVMDAIASTLALYDPTVSMAGTITMETIASALALYQPAVVPGSVTVAANAIASTLALSEPSVTPGSVTVAANAIGSTLTVYQISDVAQAAVIGMQAIDSTLVVYLLTVDGGVAVAAFQISARGSLPVYTALASLPVYTAEGSLPVYTAKGSTT